MSLSSNQMKKSHGDGAKLCHLIDSATHKVTLQIAVLGDIRADLQFFSNSSYHQMKEPVTLLLAISYLNSLPPPYQCQLNRRSHSPTSYK